MNYSHLDHAALLGNVSELEEFFHSLEYSGDLIVERNRVVQKHRDLTKSYLRCLNVIKGTLRGQLYDDIERHCWQPINQRHMMEMTMLVFSNFLENLPTSRLDQNGWPVIPKYVYTSIRDYMQGYFELRADYEKLFLEIKDWERSCWTIDHLCNHITMCSRKKAKRAADRARYGANVYLEEAV